MSKKFPLVIIILLVLFTAAFISSEVIYHDGFEYLLDEFRLNRNYQVWESGANLKLSLEKKIVNTGENSLGVEIVSPNPLNQSITGSIFRPLELLEGNWSGASGVRFWISNPNETPLFISFNVKERFREYWAVADEGVFYFQDESGVISQQEIYHSNLLIPEQFQGDVMIPFESFAVPEWNTAHTNHILDLNRIESYAFSVMVGEITPLTFYIDDFEVFGKTTFHTLDIEGVERVNIPQSGELLENFNARLGSLQSMEVEDVEVTWSIVEPYDPTVSINNEGVMRIPAEAENAVITLVAQYHSEQFSLINTHVVILEGGEGPESVDLSATKVTPPVVENELSYHSYSARFDRWSTENRPLFVILMVIGVMIFLFILSSIQNRLN